MLDLFLDESLKEEQIHFTTLFTKISYLSLKFGLEKDVNYFLHHHRKSLELLNKENASEEKLNLAIHALVKIVTVLEDLEIPEDIYELYDPPSYEHLTRGKTERFIKAIRVHVFAYDQSNATLEGIDELFPEDKVKIKLNVVGKNDDYNSLLRYLDRRRKFPIILNLEDVEIDEDNVYIPKLVVFEPDYLMDITTVSECFKPGESNPLFYFIKKFIPVFQNKYLIIGNVANYFLDELFYKPESTFSELVKKTFRISPLGFAMMNDVELKEVVSNLKTHFYTIKQVIERQLKVHAISTENVYLEPSFYSPRYGFQGRLDMFALLPDENEAKIIELKSGKPYRSNSYGLNINHYVQTLLYDLIIQSVSESKLKISSFILYSSQSTDPLRFAPPLKVQQKEAIKLRNQLVEIDYLLADIELDNSHLFSFIKSNYIKSDGFARRDIEIFQKAYEASSNILRKYFNAYTAFIAREQILAKTGEFGLDRSNGLAGLWLDDMQEKIDNFQVLNALKIHELKGLSDHTLITFLRTDDTALNANFRKGDLGVIYPFNAGKQSVLRNQVFKCSIIYIDQTQVKVRLRNKQQNTSIFITEDTWHIEHDHLDHGFNAMYQDLFLFLNTSKDYQDKMLGLKPPQQVEEDRRFENDFMTDEQSRILGEMISAKDYYLLWGPPGTGKTSVVLYEYIRHSFLETKDTILVLAYTNRAVDEICEAISRVGHKIEEAYFRIGSRYSSDERYVDDLLVTKLEDIDNRFDLLNMLRKSRVIVSTLASIQGKKELFSLVHIDTIVVDEASQILEPQLIGFLSKAAKFILIGDHYQLPAIVRQREDESILVDEELRQIGLLERRNSLFERMYKTCQSNSWDWALGRLSMQGRMHQEIMNFANLHFYNGFLSTIPSREDLTLSTSLRRMLFYPTLSDQVSITFKTNLHEAKLVAKIVSEIIERYQQSDELLHDQSIGVITPYRAQISAIKSALFDLGIRKLVNVDTVERYQGSARDIIVISMCLNIESQLKQMISLSSDGIDRKLNVALTRARKQVIILGNEEIMRKNVVYASLIDSCERD